jgi:hypothetical protein
VRGSISQCAGDYGSITKRADWHINGNALYRLDDPAFDALLGRVRDFFPPNMDIGVEYPGCATGFEHERG